MRSGLYDTDDECQSRKKKESLFCMMEMEEYKWERQRWMDLVLCEHINRYAHMYRIRNLGPAYVDTTPAGLVAYEDVFLAAKLFLTLFCSFHCTHMRDMCLSCALPITHLVPIHEWSIYTL
jgi:hypothetical protein